MKNTNTMTMDNAAGNMAAAKAGSNSLYIRRIVFTAMLAAVAGALMSLEFTVPLMPPFYKIDFSDVPTMIAVFLMGPVSGICVEVIKLLIKVFTVGTNSAYVGEVANLIGILIFVLPLHFIYKAGGRTFKAAVIAMVVTVPLRTCMSCFINAFITLPLYCKAYGMEMSDIIAWVASINPMIKDLRTFICFATIPFNLLKGALNSVVGYFLYSRLVKFGVVASVKQK